MKKFIVGFLLIFLLFLTSCQKSEFVNLAAFCENYSMYETLNLQSFVSYNDENTNIVYETVLGGENEKVLLSLFAQESGRIYECRVTVSKINKKGNKTALSESLKKFFYEVCANSLSSFTYKNILESKDFLTELDLVNKCALHENFEATKEFENFRITFISNEICSEFILKNKWLCEIETTLKPENKNNFAEVTSIRTETVPHS